MGEVERISPQGKTTQTVTTFTVVILVRNRGSRLKAGMSASVDIEIFNKTDVLLIPNEALMDPRTQQTRDLMAENGLSIPVDSAAAMPAREEGGARSDMGGGMFQRGQNMSDEERARFREQMRQRFESMTPEQRQQMAQRFGGGGGVGGGFGGRRRQQEQDVNEVKWRVVLAKSDGVAKPKLIKVGVGNFDQTVVVEGLVEGDEVEVKTISRAKIAQEEFNERMRSRNAMGSPVPSRR
jgi:HlyD family secretion protein